MLRDKITASPEFFRHSEIGLEKSERPREFQSSPEKIFEAFTSPRATVYDLGPSTFSGPKRQPAKPAKSSISARPVIEELIEEYEWKTLTGHAPVTEMPSEITRCPDTSSENLTDIIEVLEKYERDYDDLISTGVGPEKV